MSRTLINFSLDVLLLLVMLGLTWITCLLKLVFPPPTRAAGWTLWGLDYEGWSNLQFGLLGGFLLGILVHLMLHWTWVCSVVRTRLMHRSGKVNDGSETLYGVAMLISLVLVTTGLLLAAEVMIHGPSRWD